MSMLWRDAMQLALYGPAGFFVSGAGPAAHFRTSVHASPVFASALLRLIHQLDAALDHPDPFDVVDVGAGRGELLDALSVGVASPESAEPSPAAPVPLARRVRFTAVELAARPADLPDRITWTNDIPAGITGLLLATEWLDNVPLDLATCTEDGWHHLLVDPTTGEETTGAPVGQEDAAWLRAWWPGPACVDPGAAAQAVPDGPSPAGSGARAAPTDPTHRPERAEIGRTRDEAWADAVRHVDRGLVLAVDYGHLRGARPIGGSLTGYRDGRQVAPVPDGSCDITAHVAIDSVASAGERVARCAYSLGSQRDALRALGADGGRPPLSLAGRDPVGYVRALAEASAAAELTDSAGLGGHWWLWQPVGVHRRDRTFMARWRV
ncbi:SAM-dependent methyltransferase [Micromonospora sp. Llam7]|uniref:SAM-dependent methyltransferase n=1 Tax=Micromonospora tarapacensis TaxID=2835305 RepID=UPI001C82B0C4|nr:SAM-dependent methyltransferase [Micromonospora tarapacensis]MBX7264852.1 SAM-dependent methyltransferase [Micromonospora tarapacensis]